MVMKIVRWTFALALIGMLAVGIFVGGFAAGHLLNTTNLGNIPSSVLGLPSRTTVTPPPEAGTPVNLEAKFIPFWEVWELIHKNYYAQPIDDQALVYGAIKGMIQALGDKHSGYLTPVEAKIDSSRLSGDLEGIGAEVELSGKYLRIISPMPGSPAEAKGILPGDLVIKVDGEDIGGQDLYTIISKVRGTAGTKVKLTIMRDGEKDPLEIEITRAKITIASVESKMLDNDIAYVKINSFGARTGADLQDQLRTLMAKKPKGLILDLRNNPGGYLTAAVDVGTQFLNRKPLMIERWGDGREEKIDTRGNGLATEVPLVVLINQGSASASELVTGAIRDNKRGTILGETSYGKGTVQTVVDLNNDQGEVRLTIARWLTPNGTWVHEKGIAPDIEVKLTKEDREAKRDPQLEAAIKTLKK